MSTAPELDIDIFSDEVLDDPWAAYRTIRDAGPVVHLTQELYDVYAVGRFADARTALRDWRTFISSEGVGFNDLAQAVAQATVAGNDPPVHDQLRSLMMERLRLSEMRDVAPLVQASADALVAELVARDNFDAVKDLAERFVPAVVGELVGLQGDLLYQFALQGDTAFTVMGPANERMMAGAEVVLEMFTTMAELTKDDFVPGSMGWDLYEAAEEGKIPEDMAATALFNYVGPGFDTTIKSIGNALWILGRDPDQWKALRHDLSLMPSAINEITRLESPIHTWARFCPGEATVDGVTIPAGSRVALLLGSANRDERNYANPDDFDIRRNPADHLGFGHGIHVCVGAPLARIQMTAVLTALCQQVTHLEIDEPVRQINNTTRGLASLPVVIS